MKNKNIHILPILKPSRLSKINNILIDNRSQLIEPRNYQNIYITSDEEINNSIKPCWCVNTVKNTWSDDLIYHQGSMPIYHYKGFKKIILTTDQDLIADGIQEIPNDFLEWFVKNPSCEFVEVKSETLYEHKDTYRPYTSDCKNLIKTKVNYYLSIIPQDQPKQEQSDYNGKQEIKWISENLNCKQVDSCYNSLSKKCICPKLESKKTIEEVADKLYPFYGDVELREAVVQGYNHAQTEIEQLKKDNEDLVNDLNDLVGLIDNDESYIELKERIKVTQKLITKHK